MVLDPAAGRAELRRRPFRRELLIGTGDRYGLFASERPASHSSVLKRVDVAIRDWVLPIVRWLDPSGDTYVLFE
jgi:hypothetical protein